MRIWDAQKHPDPTDPDLDADPDPRGIRLCLCVSCWKCDNGANFLCVHYSLKVIPHKAATPLKWEWKDDLSSTSLPRLFGSWGQ